VRRALLALVLLGVPCGHAAAQDVGAAGTYVLVTAGLFVPPEAGALGLTSTGEVGYQLDLGKVSLSVGGRVSGYFSSDVSFAAGLACARLELPLHVASPFVTLAIGPGYLSERSKLDVSYQAGGGFLIGLTEHAAIGAEALFTQLGATSFNQLSLGPVLRAML
jgi:opacity protein-like surface antigen